MNATGPGRSGRLGFPLTLVLGALVWAGLAGAVARIPLTPDEPLPLRWLRKLGEHPVRGGLALGLALAALRKGPGGPPTASPDPPGRSW